MTMEIDSSSLSKKLFRGSADHARETMQTITKDQGYCILSFVYFAQAMKYDLYRDDVMNTYKKSVLASDIVCIDGIAMQLFDYSGQFFFKPNKRNRTSNLNGTDFLPFILEQTKDKKVGIILTTVYDPHINKGPERMDKGLQQLQSRYPHISIIFTHQTLFAHRGENFPFEQLTNKLKQVSHQYDHILFLNGIGSPIQEIRSQQHKDFFAASNIMVLNNGATIDYYSGFEKRAPQRVVDIRVGETLRRVLSQPKKNLHKLMSMFRIIPYRGYLISKKRKKCLNNNQMSKSFTRKEYEGKELKTPGNEGLNS